MKEHQITLGELEDLLTTLLDTKRIYNLGGTLMYVIDDKIHISFLNRGGVLLKEKVSNILSLFKDLYGWYTYEVNLKRYEVTRDTPVWFRNDEGHHARRLLGFNKSFTNVLTDGEIVDLKKGLKIQES